MNRLFSAALAIAVGAVVTACGRTNDEPAARAAFGEYDVAFRAGNLGSVKAHLAAERAVDFTGENADQLFATAVKMRPPDVHLESCVVSGSKATVMLSGTMVDEHAMGVASLIREKGVWVISREKWTVMIENNPPPPPIESMPAAVRAIVDRVASSDPMEGSKAWLEIGARYQSASAFLAEVKPALWDKRPVRFAMVEQTFSGNGPSFRYFTAEPPASNVVAVPAGTVGKALRYHLWQYEDVSNSGFKDSFAEWWATYAPPMDLPGRVMTINTI